MATFQKDSPLPSMANFQKYHKSQSPLPSKANFQKRLSVAQHGYFSKRLSVAQHG
jgi:hypothetical protein